MKQNLGPFDGGGDPSAAQGGHLTLATLLELVEGKLAAAEAELAREHLLLCPGCLARSRSLLKLPDPPADAGIDVGPDEIAAAWRELGRLVPLGAERPKGPREEESSATGLVARRPPSPIPLWLATAAALLVGAAGGFWLAPRPGQPAGLVTAASTQLLPQDFAVLGTLSEPAAAACPPPGGAFVFVLGGLDNAGVQGAGYRVELVEPGGAEHEISATATRFGEIELMLGRALENGAYRIVARRISAGSGEPAAIKQYRLIVDCP